MSADGAHSASYSGTDNVVRFAVSARNSLYAGWAITNDLNHNRYMLQLNRFDGSLFPRLYLWYRPPTMLPTEQLWTTAAYQAYEKERGAAGRSMSASIGLDLLAGVAFGVVGLVWSLL